MYNMRDTNLARISDDFYVRPLVMLPRSLGAALHATAALHASAGVHAAQLARTWRAPAPQVS